MKPGKRIGFPPFPTKAQAKPAGRQNFSANRLAEVLFSALHCFFSCYPEQEQVAWFPLTPLLEKDVALTGFQVDPRMVKQERCFPASPQRNQKMFEMQIAPEKFMRTKGKFKYVRSETGVNTWFGWPLVILAGGSLRSIAPQPTARPLSERGRK